MLKTSKRLHLKEELFTQLQNGLLHPGEMIPSENNLCLTYGLTRPTVRSVLAELCKLGMLEKRPGIGTFVRNAATQQVLPSRMIKIGSDIFYSASEYFSRPITAGILDSPFAQNSSFVHLSQTYSQPSDLKDLDAFLIADLAESKKQMFLSLKKPLVQVAHVSTQPQFGFVTTDNQAEAKRGVDYLIRYGHKKIAVIGAGDCPQETAVLRTKGWQQAIEEAGLPVPGAENRFPISKVNSVLRDDFLKWVAHADFTAIFFTNGVSFLNTYPYLMEHFGKSFYDLSFLIFDDLSKMPLFSNLNAVFIRQPLKDYGRHALRYLHHKIADPDYPVMRQYLRSSIIIK